MAQFLSTFGNSLPVHGHHALRKVNLQERHILFDLGTAVMVSRLIEGDFIRYAQSFSDDYKTEGNTIAVHRNNIYGTFPQFQQFAGQNGLGVILRNGKNRLADHITQLHLITANDLEIGIRTAPIDADIAEMGEIAIEARISPSVFPGTTTSVSPLLCKRGFLRKEIR
mgnify:CR=1 FL=1